MSLNDFIKSREEMNKERRAKEKRLGITGMQIRVIKDYANSILTNANNIEFTQLAVKDEVISYENGRKIIEWQKKQINENIEYLKAYTDERGMKNE